MARIVMADRPMEILERAAAYLRSVGHDVAVFSDGQALISEIQQRLPDVLAVSGFTKHVDGMAILGELARIDPCGNIGILWLTIIDATGVAIRDWEAPVSGFVLRDTDPWQIALSVEQLLHRRVST